MNFEKLFNKAIQLHLSGKIPEALVIYRQALKLNPNYIDALNNQGICLQTLNRHEEALVSYTQALRLRPDYANLYYNQGICLKVLNRHEEALASYTQAIKLKPDYIEALNNQGNCLQSLNRHEEALASYTQAIKLKLGNVEAHYNQGNCLKVLNRHEEALASYTQAIKLKPDYIEALNNQGNSLKSMNRHEEALASYTQALTFQPGYAEAFNNQGSCLQSISRYEEALASYTQAIKLQPDHVEAHLNLSLLQLLQGNFKEGWKNYEWRKKLPENKKTYTSITEQLAWSGEQDLKNTTILISKEQGLGDYIQCCRYLPMIQDLGAKITLDISKSLRSLIDTLDIDKTYADESQKVQFQYHCTIMSLPLAFKTELDTIPKQNPYLFATDDKKRYWQEKLGKKTATRIGLVWSGNISHENDRNRSLSLDQLKPWLNLPYEFHSLQIDYRDHDLKLLPTFPNLYCHEKDISDFSDTAGLIESMDLIICVDTSVAHLAGALGKKVLILLPYAPDFRWLLDRTDSPWYPTAKLFRQPEINNWRSVVMEIKKLLLNL